MDVISGIFHGEAQPSPSTAMTFSDGIGSADDYKYEDGVFSAKFHAYATDDAMGGVKFGDGEASGTAEAWVARGGNVTLTAVSEEGFEFAGWTGDTWAITAFAELGNDALGKDVADEQIKVYAAETVEGLESAAPMSEGVTVTDKRSAVKVSLEVETPPGDDSRFFRVGFGE